MKWPGIAAVEVALVTITKQSWKRKFVLAGKEVNTITPYLDDAETLGNPYALKQNEGKSFQGSIVLGKGFVLEPNEAKTLIENDPRNKDVLFPYSTGDDLNNNPDQSPSRWVINFFDWPEEKAKQYPDCFEILERLVKPEREKISYSKNASEKWWLYERLRVDLYERIKGLKTVLSSSRVSKYINHSYIDCDFVFDVGTNIIIRIQFFEFGILQSNLHNEWAWKYASSLESRIRYLNVDCIDTFSFPQSLSKKQEQKIETIGETYHAHRRQLMLKMQLGLTKTYNAFHSRYVNLDIKTSDLEEKTNKEIEKKYGKETWNLWNHLQKSENTYSWEEAVEGIEELRRLHVEMDNAVLEAYGWHENTEKWGKAIALKHDFYEVDYLPENDRVRFTIHPNARKEVLKRLLLLNHERYEEEIKQGLHKKKDVEKFYEQKGQPVPAGVVFSDGKSSTKKKTSGQSKKAAPKIYGQHNLFGEAAEPEPKIKVTKSEPVIDSSLRKIEWHHSLKSFKVIITNSSGHEFRYHVFPEAQRGQFTKDYKQISPNSPMALNIIGKQEGDSFEFGGEDYRIERIEM